MGARAPNWPDLPFRSAPTRERALVSSDEQDRKTGGVPHAFGNVLAWKWSREMPATCKGGFLTMLYALRQMAAPSGELRFNGNDRAPLKLPDLAKAAGCREKDARRYIDAAIRAGVVVVVGERKRGKATLYQLVVSPFVDWTRAADHLKATARNPDKKWPKDDPAHSSGHGGPNPEGSENGPQGPEDALDGPEEVRATGAVRSSGHGGPPSSGHGGPNNPCGTHAGYQERVDVVPPLRTPAGARDEQDQFPGQQKDDKRRCGCGVRLIRESTTICHGCRQRAEGAQEDHQQPVQGVFLTPVPSATSPGAPGAAGPLPAPRENPADPLRICGCGREYRAAKPGRCRDCILAEHDEEQRQAVNG